LIWPEDRFNASLVRLRPPLYWFPREFRDSQTGGGSSFALKCVGERLQRNKEFIEILMQLEDFLNDEILSWQMIKIE